MSEELEEICFVSEELDKVVTDIIEGILSNKQYEEREVPRWINEVNEAVTAKLVDQQRPFKFLVNTLIMQRKGANVIITHNNYWDSTFDYGLVVVWPKEKTAKSESNNKETIQCMVSVYALSALNGMSYTKN